jgi:hypothetical protein
MPDYVSWKPLRLGGKMFLKRFLSLFFILGASLLVLARAGFAYLDPGAGSFACQMLLAGIVGAIFLAKVYWRKIRSIFLVFFNKDIQR